MITSRFSIMIILVFLLSAWLFYVKYSVISLEDKIKTARKNIIVERKNLHINKAEYKSLTTPERIKQLASKYLDMHVIEPEQIVSYSQNIFYSPNDETSINSNVNASRHNRKLSDIVAKIINAEDSN